MKLAKTILIQLIVVVLFAGAMLGLNVITGPLIEANNAGKEFGPLLSVMPQGAEFDGEALIYNSENPSAFTLANVPASVKKVYKEKNGLGYAIACTGESQYSTAPMEITIGITADGKICGIEINSYNDSASFDFRAKDPNYLGSYVGKDSALADVGLVAGSTYSSQAFKTAVSEAMGVLIANGMIEEGVKSVEQILTELIPVVAEGFTSLEEVAISGNIVKAYKTKNDIGFAYIVAEGEDKYLAIVNASGVCKVYNAEGIDVTADHGGIVTEVKAHASANQADTLPAFKTKIEAMMAGATNLTLVEVATFNNVRYAVKFNVDANEYYAFYATPIGFEQMDIYYILDSNGAIAKLEVKELIFEKQYFFGFAGVPDGYLDGFNGKTDGTWSDDIAIIATATMTSNAMKLATQDTFKTFNAIKGGQN